MNQLPDRGRDREELARGLGRPSALSSQHLHQRPFLGRVLVATGVLAGVLGLLEILMVIPLGDEGAQAYFDKLPRVLQIVIAAVPEETPLLLLMLPGVAVVVASFYVVRLGRRHLASTYEVTEPHEFRDPILYLRPFAADESKALQPGVLGKIFTLTFDKWDWTWKSIFLHGVTRYEELLAYAFRRVGGIVAIGDPKERLPRLGATRIYAATREPVRTQDEEAWKREVGAQISNARLVLLHIGSSEGLRWEIEKVVELADPLRVVLCVSPSGNLKPSLPTFHKLRAEAIKAWAEFREACGSAFPRGLPETIGDARFVRFDADWTTRPVERPQRKLFWFIPGRDPDLSRGTVESALSWLTWIMVPESFARRIARRIVNYVLFVVGVVVVVAVLVTGIGVLTHAFR